MEAKVPKAEKEAAPKTEPAVESTASPKVEAADPVVVYNRWCKGCGICIAFCPTKVLEMGDEGKAVVARPESCTRCQICELHCPDFAITVRRKEG
jgi:2-oxoglutarate ferredoxin oxidoreductase subunit delta